MERRSRIEDDAMDVVVGAEQSVSQTAPTLILPNLPIASHQVHSFKLANPSSLIRLSIHSTRPLQLSSKSLNLSPTHSLRFFSWSCTSLAKPPPPSKKRSMPPKKGAVVEKAKLGRPSNNLKMGIVGLPNVGKSSLFNVIAKCDLGKSANFPYATIEPEEARVPVPDERFLWLCDLYKPKSQIPAFLTCIDIAGLTAGASTGAGLGNAFLSNVRAVDGIFQVVREYYNSYLIS